MSLLLDGKRALVTGGTRGIGAALCRVFAAEGADVAFTYVSRDDLAEKMVETVRGSGRRALAFKASVRDREAMRDATREIVERWGGIDVLVNNAAINRRDSFATTSEKAWDEIIDTNVNGLFAVTKPVFRQMIRQRKGNILNISSIAAVRSLPTSVHYATSKAAVIGFTKCLSREGSPFGVTVNAIAAGIYETDLARTLPDKLLRTYEAWVPRGRLGQPDELAQVAAFLVCDRNSFMNGEVVIVDGGALT